MTDQARESRINTLRINIPTLPKKALAKASLIYCQEIRARSPEQVARMERDRGLCVYPTN